MSSKSQFESAENSFVEFRRKVRAAEMLSSAMERLLRELQFTGLGLERRGAEWPRAEIRL